MKNIQLDDIDLKLLRLLQVDGTLSNKELAFKVHKSIGAVHERVKKLKAHGYIKQTVAILDRHKVGMGLLAFSQVFLISHTSNALEEFEEAVAKFPEVMECYQMTGSYDFILRIASKDMNTYHLFLRKQLATLPNIRTIQSYFVLSETKSDTAFPI